MFSYVDHESRIQKSHPLHKIRRIVDAALEDPEPTFNEMHNSQGCPSIPPEQLQDYIQQQVAAEGYGDHLLNLRVEFVQANGSSIDLTVITDYSGELGDLYNRLRRAIQR
jgi:hypothetical protein